MAEKKKMSVAEMLAAARKADGGGGEDAPASPSDDAAAAEDAAVETSAVEESAAEETAADAAPASPPQKIAKPGSKDRPGVSDILAMARANKTSGGGEKAKPKAPAKAKAKAKAPAAAATAKPQAAKPQATERDTASILAAARKANKPGPMSKADAAARKKADPKGPVKKAIVVPPMPAKPDYAKASKADKKALATGDVDAARRGFLSLGFWSLGIVTALWTLLSVKFFFPNVRREPPSKFKVGPPDGFAPGQVETKFKAQFGVWIVNTEYNGEQQLFALKSVCTHLGCTPNWLEAEQKFKCPCHGSGFYKDGINFEGPAPRPLERYAIQLASDGQVEIDKSKTFQEEMGHWSDPTSFVSV